MRWFWLFVLIWILAGVLAAVLFIIDLMIEAKNIEEFKNDFIEYIGYYIGFVISGFVGLVFTGVIFVIILFERSVFLEKIYNSSFIQKFKDDVNDEEEDY